MNKTIKIVILLIIFGVSVNAQNSGYQGKKFSLHYNLYFANALSNPNEFGNQGFFSFNTLHHADMDACVARRLTLGLSFEYIHTSFSYKKDFNFATLHPAPPYSSFMINTNFSSSAKGSMEVYGIGFFLKRYFKGNIAPLGTYIKPHIQLLFYKVYPGNPKMRDGYYNDLGPEMRNYSPYKTVGVSLELGQNRILFNRMFIDYGLRLGIIPGVLRVLNSVPTERTYLKEIPLRRLANQYLFNIKVGVGVLLF